ATLKSDGPSEFSDLFDDTPGPVPITVTWQQFVPGSVDECSASISSTVQLQAPVPLKLSKRPKRLVSRFQGTFVWATRLGPHADRRPIEVRVRGVRKAKLPGSRVPFKVATVALRPTDPGFAKTRFFRTPRFLVTARYLNFFELDAEQKVGSLREKPLGYEI